MFEQFWALYPKKAAKKEALKAFDKLRHEQKLSALNALPNHIQYWKATATEKMYIPHPASWLNGERWEDEIEMPQPEQGKAWFTTEQGMLQKGRELNTEPKVGESWQNFKTRLTGMMRG
jgi:hypothetical protein